MNDATKPRREGPYAMWVILAGLGAMTVVTIAALVRYADPSAIVTALGPVTGVIGTLVGAYFGMRGSSLAQQHATAAEMARMQAAARPAPPSQNGHAGTPVVTQRPLPADTTSETARFEELAAIDEPSDEGDMDVDLPDPDDVALDPAPADEGDDREAHGAIR